MDGGANCGDISDLAPFPVTGSLGRPRFPSLSLAQSIPRFFHKPLAHSWESLPHSNYLNLDKV